MFSTAGRIHSGLNLKDDKGTNVTVCNLSHDLQASGRAIAHGIAIAQILAHEAIALFRLP